MDGDSAAGDRPRRLLPATRYEPMGDLRTAAARLFRWLAWGAAMPSFGLLWLVLYDKPFTISHHEETHLVADFFMVLIAAWGIGITALFTSVALWRRSWDLSLLLGGCTGATLAIYLPWLVKAWPVLKARQLAPAGVVSLLFPFVLTAIAALVVIRDLRRRRRPPDPV